MPHFGKAYSNGERTMLTPGKSCDLRDNNHQHTNMKSGTLRLLYICLLWTIAILSIHEYLVVPRLSEAVIKLLIPTHFAQPGDILAAWALRVAGFTGPCRTSESRPWP